MSTTKRGVLIVIAVAVLLLILVASAYAQGNRGGLLNGTKTLSGQVTSLNPLTINNQPVSTDNNTVTHGTLVPGAPVQAQVVRQNDGSLLARRIDSTQNGNNGSAGNNGNNGNNDCAPATLQPRGASNTVTFQGTVENLSPLTVCGQTITTDAHTVIPRDLQVGDRVHVNAVRTNNTLLAREVNRISTPNNQGNGGDQNKGNDNKGKNKNKN